MKACFYKILSVPIVRQDLLEKVSFFILRGVTEEGLRILLQSENKFL